MIRIDRISLTNVVSRVSLLTSYTADRISPFKLGAVLQKDGDHKIYDGYIQMTPTNMFFVTFPVVITLFLFSKRNHYVD